MSKRKSPPNHIFRLSGVNPDEIDKQYFKVNNNLLSTEKFIPQQSTKISELHSFQPRQNITVVDELKNTHTAKISMTHVSNTNSVQRSLNCFWDRHPIVGDKVVYCPVDKVHTPQVKSYTSHINGKSYKIQDSVNLKIEYSQYYVDGAFCSIECCLSFIEENKMNPIYQYSEHYLRDIFGFNEQKRAPHWRLLESYGGNMTIEEFRKSFANTIYTADGVVYTPMCFIFRENYHL
jgi:hypothetical protein